VSSENHEKFDYINNFELENLELYKITEVDIEIENVEA
jgi:hypothetical protein